VLDALGNPQDRLHFVHVAGTNGKGSVCAMIESACAPPGCAPACSLRPHLAEPTERIRIDGVPVSAERFAAAFDRVHAVRGSAARQGRHRPAHHLLRNRHRHGAAVFAEERVDMVVLEVGLGGRLDATNVVPDARVITPIDFDHEAFLGKSLESIAGEKAGILKPGVPAVFARQRPEAARVLERRAAGLAISGDRALARCSDLELDARGSRFELPGEGALRIHCPLAGEHQVENAVTAALALLRLGIPIPPSKPESPRANGPAAWSTSPSSPEDHPRRRPQSRRRPRPGRLHPALLRRRRVRLIYGAMRDKAVAEISGILFPLAEAGDRHRAAPGARLAPGHLPGDPVDLLFDGVRWHEFAAPRIATPHTHGTGCAYSAAITACLALGVALPEAVARAKRWIAEAIRTNPGLGRGAGPINHHAAIL
jgi:dihydrofolate synthase / folylpolyglutamate synthase